MEALIDPTNPDDPIAAQFRPDARELEIAPDELSDPIGDDAHTPVKGVVHRYRDRCLLKLVHVCPVYCRFCFRREMVGPQGDGTLTGAELDAALAYIASAAAKSGKSSSPAAIRSCFRRGACARSRSGWRRSRT